MILHRSASGVHVRALAKLNLLFEVLGKRDDGYHEIETLMVPVGLYDELFFAPAEEGSLAIRCCWLDRSDDRKTLGELPSEDANLVTRALGLLRERAGISLGARVELFKRIPAAAGLGGGSSDAAAALLAANVVWQLNWSQTQLAEVAAELGSDVPFFLQSAAAVCRGRGEQIEPIGPLGAWSAVVVRPPVGISTAAVYGKCVSGKEASRTQALIAAFRSSDERAIRRHLFNRLESPAEQISPVVAQLREAFSGSGCVAAQLTGSGSCYFGICRSARHARSVAARLHARGVGRLFVVRFEA